MSSLKRSMSLSVSLMFLAYDAYFLLLGCEVKTFFFHCCAAPIGPCVFFLTETFGARLDEVLSSLTLAKVSSMSSNCAFLYIEDMLLSPFRLYSPYALSGGKLNLSS